MIINIDLEKLTQVFPEYIEKSLKKNKNKTKLIEIVLDLGRRPEGRFLFGSEYLSQQLVSWEDIDSTTKRLGKFSNENRAGIEHSLHRISCIRNRQGNIIGLTCRIGRCVLGSIGIVRDLLNLEESLLILGKPGLGKTTLIREISQVLSDAKQKRVIIVDTANEIAGDGDTTHVGIGRARRMQVSPFKTQHTVMIEAIENHMPEVIIVDEISTELESLAARTIAERGVKLIGTTHGNSLENLIKNPTLSDLIGGIHYVTLSDEEARRRGTQKTVLERKSFSAFYFAIELSEKHIWTIHENVENSVDRLLRKEISQLQSRTQCTKRLVRIQHTEPQAKAHSFLKASSRLKSNLNKKTFKSKNLRSKINVLCKSSFRSSEKSSKSRLQQKKLSVFFCFFSKKYIKRISKLLDKFIFVTKVLKQSDVLFVSKVYLKQNIQLQSFAAEKKIPVYIIKDIDHRKLKNIIKHLNKIYIPRI